MINDTVMTGEEAPAEQAEPTELWVDPAEVTAAAVAAALADQLPLAIAKAMEAYHASIEAPPRKELPPRDSFEKREAALVLERAERNNAKQSAHIEEMRKAAPNIDASLQAKADFNNALAAYNGCAPNNQGANPLPATTVATPQRAPDVTEGNATSDAGARSLLPEQRAAQRAHGLGAAKPASPKLFDGRAPPLEVWATTAYNWLEVSDVSPDKCVSLAATYLTGPAESAWNAAVAHAKALAKQTDVPLTPFTWEFFLSTLRTHFGESDPSEEARRKLHRLVQTPGMTVADYTRQFTNLTSRITDGLKFSDADLLFRYRESLLPDVRQEVALCPVTRKPFETLLEQIKHATMWETYSSAGPASMRVQRNVLHRSKPAHTAYYAGGSLSVRGGIGKAKGHYKPATTHGSDGGQRGSRSRASPAGAPRHAARADRVPATPVQRPHEGRTPPTGKTYPFLTGLFCNECHHEGHRASACKHFSNGKPKLAVA